MPYFNSAHKATLIALSFSAALWTSQASAMGLVIDAKAACGPEFATATPLVAQPIASQDRLAESQAVSGQNDIAWVWLGSPTLRYPHGALGSLAHAGSIHAWVQTAPKQWSMISMELPFHRVFEDRVPRLVDLDGDGLDEILVVESDAMRGSALMVLGIDRGPKGSAPPKIVLRATGPRTGSTFRWLNPIGMADFDGDGKLDVASVTTPHIGGTLTLHHYRPPELVAYAKALDVSNHRMGALEQNLAAIVHRPGQRPTVVVPDMTRRALHALRWEAPGKWKELADLMPMPGLVEQLSLRADGTACAKLGDGSVLRVTLTH